MSSQFGTEHVKYVFFIGKSFETKWELASNIYGRLDISININFEMQIQNYTVN